MIRKRKTAKGAARYQVRVYRGGKPRGAGTYGTLADARKSEAKAKASSRSGSMRCDEYADHFLEGYKERFKASSYATASSALGAFKRDWRGIALDRVERVEAEKWARGNRWAVPAVVTLFNAAKQAKLVDDNPFAGLSQKGPGRKHKDPLSVEQVDELAEAASDVHGDFGPKMKALILFLAYSGVRPGEAFALESGDLNFGSMRINVKRRLYAGEVDLPKANKAREIVLLPEARDAILGLDRSSDLIFTGKRGGQISQPLLSWYWGPVVARFGKPVQPYHLRHFAGHHFYVTMGLADYVVAEQLGHNDGGKLVRDLYGHGDFGALEAIDRAVAANVVPLREASAR